jgi:AsmA protein
MQRRWIKFVLAAVVLFVLVIGLVPFLINADTFRPKIESELSSSLGRKVTLGHLSLSLITGSLVANDISIADDSTFSSAPFLEAKQLHFGIELGQFLFHHLVQITDITIDSPAIHLIHNQNGTWNFSNIGSASGSTQAGSQQDSIIPSLTIAKLKIKDGSAILSTIPVAGKPFECTAINLDVQQFSFAKSFPFQLSVKVPGDGSLQLNGNAGPISQKDAADTPFQAKLQVTHFDPVAANVVQPSDGISMLADFDAQVASDGTNLTSNGKIVATRLQLARNGSPAPQPVNIDYTISDNLDARAGKVSDLSVHNGSAAVQVTGGFKMTGQAVVLNLHLAAPTVSIDQLEQLLPAVGVNLPSGSKLQGGTITANLAITGPATATTIAGPVEMDNTQLAGFDLGSKIQGINRLAGTSGGTGIQKLRTDLESSPQGTRFSNIDGSIPAIGTATGNGTVSSSGALDFQLVAKFSGSSAVGAVANQGMNALAGLLGDRSNTAADKGIPLTIAGTTSNPTFRANVGAMIKQQAGGLLGQSSGQQPSNAVKTLKGLFGK